MDFRDDPRANAELVKLFGDILMKGKNKTRKSRVYSIKLWGWGNRRASFNIVTGQQKCCPVIENCCPIKPNFVHWAAYFYL